MAVTTIESKATNDSLVWCHPNRDIVIGSQILVNESEEALLFENGQLVQILQAGKHLIESGNIPGLDALIRRSIGNNSPIKLDVWFVSKTSSTDYKWGVQLQAKDTTHQLIVPVGSYGSMLLRIQDPASFVVQVVGKKMSMTKQELKDFLVPNIERSLKDYIADKIKKGTLDIFTIESILEEASADTKKSIDRSFERFGLKLLDFFIQGIEVIGDNPEYIKIKESLADAASLRIRAKAASESQGFYQQERALDALNKAAEKDSNVAGKLMSEGLGRINFGGKTKTESAGDLKMKLSSLKDLYDEGLISEKEYEKKKQDLLGQI
ncbi:SPFH domain-containing protein [Prochlorococcus sp. MIT 1223]|uniref:SPFH domain-containing protein n=1 Tax=Prochlorococcus sp. MIT 1223 TaxID=3096217 RepID=UPI002A74B46F|nr:SPFH domain-containing protein [Prochlorococcus sp. MIT 1223]